MKKEENIKMKYYIYCRKSQVAEDKQIMSIEDQERELLEYARKNTLEVVDIFKESQSAHYPGRPVFLGLMTKIKKGNIHGLLVYHANRISRNPTDSGIVLQMIDDEEIKEVRTPSHIYHNDPTDKLMLALEFIISKKDSDDKSVVVKRALKGRALRGLPNGVSKVGFLNDMTEEKGNRKWIVDKIRFPLMEQLFQKMLKGKSSPAQIYRHAKNNLKLKTLQRKKIGGKPIAFSYVYKLLRDPVYAGFFFHNGQRCELDKRLPRAITEEEYWKIQAMLGLKGRPQPSKHEGLYNHFLTCGQCNGRLSPDFKFQLICPVCKLKFSCKNTEKCPKCDTKTSQMTNPIYCSYIYYYCINNKKHRSVCPASTIEQKKIEETIYEKFTNEICISKELSDWCLKHLSIIKDEEIKDELDIKVSLDDQEIKIKKKLNNLLSYRITRQDITSEQAEIFDTQEKELQQEWSDIKQRKSIKIDWYSEAVKEFNLMTEIEDTLKNGTPADKRELFYELRSNLTVTAKNLSISNRKSINAFAECILRARSENRAFEPKKITALQLQKTKSKSLFRVRNKTLEPIQKTSESIVSKGSLLTASSNRSLKLSETRNEFQASGKSSVNAQHGSFESTFSTLLRG